MALRRERHPIAGPKPRDYVYKGHRITHYVNHGGQWHGMQSELRAWPWMPRRYVPPREAFAHNVLAHPLLWAWPRLGTWLHERTDP